MKFIAMIMLLSAAALADQVSDCTDYLYSQTSLSRDQANQICRQGVSVACIDYLYSRTSADRISAANHCAGNVTVQCIENKYSSSSYDRLQSADWCGGRLP